MKPQSSAAKIRNAQRREKAAALRLQGMRLSAIGAEMSISKQAVSILLRKIIGDLDKATGEAAKEIRDRQLTGIRAVLSVMLPKALLGDVHAADRVRAFWEREAALTGIDAPKKSEVDVSIYANMPPAELAEQTARALIEYHTPLLMRLLSEAGFCIVTPTPKLEEGSPNENR